MNESRGAWIALNLLAGLSPHQRARLVRSCGGPDRVFSSRREDLRRVPGLRAEMVDRIAGLDWMARADREIHAAEAKGIAILTPDDATYPARLRTIFDPPPALYLRGSLRPADDLCVAVVGSRSPSAYGLSVARELAQDLARRRVTVVSGLAIGADAAAHRGALAGGGRTLAVLGSGLDVPYPRRNRRLLEEVAERGAVLSEYPLGTDPRPWHFPQRNRVIAGMTLATVVVEASSRSGSLITAREALEAGREVFAVPGKITSPLSVGSNYLIRAGYARLIQRADEVIEELPAEWRSRAGDAPEADAAPAPPGLAQEEARLLARLESEEPVHVDALARACGMDLGPLLDTLLSLEIRRLVRPVPGGRYVRAEPPLAGPKPS